MSEIVPNEQPATAQTVIKTIMDTAAITGLHVNPSARKIVGNHAKIMLADGMRLDLVTAACYLAILRGKPGTAQYIALDLQLSETGMGMSDKEYEEKLAMYSASGKARRSMLEEAQDRQGRKRSEIERRRRETGGS